MFKKSYQIEGVETVLVADLIVYKLTNGELHAIGNKSVKIAEEVFSYRLDGRHIFLQEENLGNLIRIDSTNFHTDKIEGAFSLRGAFYVDDQNIYILGKNEGKKVVYVLNKKSLTVKIKTDYRCFPSITTSKGCICKIKLELQYISSLLHQLFWTYSFPEGEKVMGDIFLHENVLLVPSMAGQMPNNRNYLQGVDVNTGKEIWKNEEYFLHLQQHKTSGLLYGFAGEKYQVIDPITGNKMIDKKFVGLKEEKRLQVYQGMSRIYEDGLYFISDYVENHYDCQFGMINTETHEIEFIQKLDVAKGVKADPPIYHKGSLYIKDSLDTLHVYGAEKVL